MRALVWIVTLASLVGAVGILGRLRDPADPVRQGYLSVAPKETGRMVAGFDNVAADLLFIRFTAYWGYQLRHGRHFQNLYPLLDLITDLDPRFRPAFEMGALALGDSGKPMEAVALLDKGAKTAPQDEWFPHQAGLILFFYGDDPMRAARYFERAARMPNARPASAYFAARMYAAADRRDLALQTWQRVYATAKDPSVKQVARNALIKLVKNRNDLSPKSDESML